MTKCECCKHEFKRQPILPVGEVYDYCKECESIIEEVINAISIARSVGVPRYGPASWRDVSVQEHLEHASKHIYQARKFYTDNADEEDHLAHAICRLSMAKALTGDKNG